MSRKTQIGWISVGVLLCLFSAVLTLKLRDSNKANAREDDKNTATNGPALPAPFPSLPLSDTPPLPPVSKPSEAKPQPPQPPDPAILRTSATEPLAPPSVAGSEEPKPPMLPAPRMIEAPLPSVGQEKKAPSEVSPLPTPEPIKIDPTSPIPPPIEVKPMSHTDVAPLPSDTAKPLPPISTGATPGKNPNSIQPLPMPPEVKKDVIPVSATSKTEPGEPPMVVPAGPVQVYQVRAKTETLPDIARRTLGSSERSSEIVRLNPDFKADSVLTLGTTVRLPADACVQEEIDVVKPLPSLRPKETEKAKVLPLTGTYPCTLDEHKNLTLPKAIREQFGNCDTVLVSPGADHCLWITNQAHLERLADRIEHSPAREADVRVFKRLYYAQTEKTSVTSEGRIAISDKLSQFAELGQDLVLVGIDEHFELWDATRWKQYTREKSAAARAAADE